MIPSCNTRFAKVKFRLKMTELETIFNSCPEGKLLRGNCPRGNFMEANIPRGSCPGGKYSSTIVWGAKTWEQKPGEQLSWGGFMRGNFLRVVVQGELFGGNFMVGRSPGVIFQGRT